MAHPPSLEDIAQRHDISEEAVSELSRLLSAMSFPANTPANTPGLPVSKATGARLSSPRYEVLGQLGAGGMGEVFRVWDRELNRAVAMKVVRTGFEDHGELLARFIEEAQIGAQLQHPGIIPIYDVGRLDDGRLYFTMMEIRGQTLRAAIAGDGWGFGQLLRAFHQVTSAVAFAHARGVLHRDLKPANIMLGGNGEVFVVDWGLAKIFGGRDEGAIVVDRHTTGSLATQVGAVVGTPAYMSPEQAAGAIDGLDARADVYALGRILDDILQLAAAPPEALVEIERRATAVAPSERFSDAGAMAQAIKAWLDGVQRRENVRRHVKKAHGLDAEAELLRQKAARLEQEAQAVLSKLPLWAKEADKLSGWALEDEAAALKSQAQRHDLEAGQQLRAALLSDPDDPEPRALLARRHMKEQQRAESQKDKEAQRIAAFYLQTHLDALPAGHKDRVEMASWLQGTGALTLVTEPPGAEVLLHTYKPHQRRLQPAFVGSLGQTPLVEEPLPFGSHLLILRAPGHEEVRYPIHIGRQEHWNGVRPGDSAPFPIQLPPKGSLGADEVYVPAGWFIAGGDELATDALPRTRLWVDPLVIHRFPITNTGYIAFLDALVDQGRGEEARLLAPRERTAGEGGLALLYGQDEAGHFKLVPDAEGDLWLPDWPVIMLAWSDAVAYCHWLSEQTGQPWRLPSEMEREKAGRGVDGRLFPWGDHFEPSWCSNIYSAPNKRPFIAQIHDFPEDESVYGVRGVSGNTMDWCLEPFVPEGLYQDLVAPDVPALLAMDAEIRCNRGGGWAVGPAFSRMAMRRGNQPDSRGITIGIRPVRPYR